MPAWLWITPLAAVAFVFWIGWGRGWLRSWRYDWQRAQHVRARAREEVEAASVFYGSMGLSDEQVLHHELPWWPAPPVDPEPWRAQMTAELCPHEYTPNVAGTYEWCQICDSVRPIDPLPEVVLPDAGGWISGPCLDDPGPGEASSLVAAPGPVTELDGGPTVSGPEGAEGVNAPPVQPSRWLAEQLEILRAWSERQQVYAEVLA